MANDKKVLAEQGVGFLCEFLKAAIQTADAAGAAVTLLSQATNQSVREIMAALNSDRPSATAFSVAANSWKANEEEDTSSSFAYACDIAIEGLTAEELAFVMVAPASSTAARQCGIGTVCRTLGGALRLYAKRVPSESIAGDYWIINGRAAAAEENDGAGETAAENPENTEGGNVS